MILCPPRLKDTYSTTVLVILATTVATGAQVYSTGLLRST